MRSNSKRKSLPVYLLCCVMLVGLLLGISVMVVNAEPLYYPEYVGGMKNGKEVCYYTKTQDGTLQANYETSNEFHATTMDAKWDAMKQTYSQKEIVGLAFYNRDKGTLYVKGEVSCYVISSLIGNLHYSLKVVVDGDTTMSCGWYFADDVWGDLSPHGLGYLNIIFRNNATLTLQEKGRGRKGVLDVGIFSQHGGTYADFRDVVLTGSGTLRIVTPNNSDAPYGIRAGNIYVNDNISLDIRMGTPSGDAFAGILCKSLHINTLGTVTIDASEYKAGADQRYCAFESLDAKSNSDYGFKLINAKSVTIKGPEKSKVFKDVSGNDGTGSYDYLCNLYRNQGWSVSEDKAATSYTVKFTHAKLPAATVSVGNGTPVTGSDLSNPPTIKVQGGEYRTVVMSLTLPDWLNQLYKDGRVKWDMAGSSLNVYRGKSLKNPLKLTSTDFIDSALPELSIKKIGLKPVGGEIFTVYGCISLVNATDGTQVAAATVIAYIETENIQINAIRLDADALNVGDKTGPRFVENQRDVGYTVTGGQPNWNLGTGAVIGKEYYTNITLKAEEGYAFPDSTRKLTEILKVTMGGETVGRMSYSLTDGGKTLKLTVYATAKHDHVWVCKPDKSGTDSNSHSEVCTISGCDAKRNTEAHDFDDITETGTWISYKCTKCGYEKRVDKTTQNEISYVRAIVTVPTAGKSAANANAWVKMEDRYANLASITDAKWTIGNVDAAASAAKFTGKFEAGKTYTLTVTFTAAEGRTFRNPQSTYPLSILGCTKWTEPVVSSNGKTMTHSVSYTAKQPVDVSVTLKGLDANGYIVPPVIEAGKAKGSMIIVKKGDDLYFYYYSDGKWVDNKQPKLAKGESARVGLALLEGQGEKNLEFTAKLADTSGIKYLDSAFADQNSVIAIFTVPDIDEKALISVDLTVTAPEYGKAPATKATVPSGANYTAGAVSWSPAEGTFAAKAYTVSIAVTPKSGYSFAESCVFNVNGSMATYKDGKVTFTFQALTAPHSHSYSEWSSLNESTHIRNCTGCDGFDIAEHRFGDKWLNDAAKGEHYRQCSDCGYRIYEKHIPDRAEATETDPVKCTECGCELEPIAGHTHTVDTSKFDSDENSHWNTCDGCGAKQNEVPHDFEWKIDKEATETERGLKHEECTVCGYKKESVEIPASGESTEPSESGKTNETEKQTETGEKSETEKQPGSTGKKSGKLILWIVLLIILLGAVTGGIIYFSRKKSKTKPEDSNVG